MHAVRTIPAVAKPGLTTALLGAAIAAAWMFAIGLHLTGGEEALHHDTLIEGGAPLFLSVGIFAAAWQVMIVSMMLPASLPTISAFRARWQSTWPAMAVGIFLAAYAVVWTGFGLAAFAGDVVTHAMVDATPWLANHPWLIQAAVLALAGGYQFTPLKRRALEACRRPEDEILTDAGPGRALTSGVRHAIECVVSSGALMLLMFAAGVANIWWMAALTAAMVYETVGHHGHRAAPVIGVALVAFAAAIVLTGGAVGIAAH